jgi:hypothetical protein
MATQKVQLCEGEGCNNRAYGECRTETWEVGEEEAGFYVSYVYLCQECIAFRKKRNGCRCYVSTRCRALGVNTKSAKKK